MQNLISSLVIIVAFLTPLLHCQDPSCQYRYTEQLRMDPRCSPYNIGVMKLECSIQIPLNASNISIGWFLDCMELTNDSHVTIVTQDMYTATDHLISSELTINDITDDYAGEYTCNILGDEEYIPSDPFRLREQTYLEVYTGLGDCVDGDVFRHAGEAHEKCAVITENNPIPRSLICTQPVATSSHDIPVTSTPVILTIPPPSLPTSTTVVQATSSLSPPPIPSSPPPPPILSPPSTTSPPPTPNVPVTTDVPGTFSDDHTFNHLIIACAVLVMITILLTIVIVCGCVWVFLRLRRVDKLTSSCPTDIRNLGEPEYDYIPDEPVHRIIDESDKPVISGFNSSFYEIKSEPVHRDVDEPIYRDIDKPSTQVISGSNPSDEITNADYGNVVQDDTRIDVTHEDIHTALVEPGNIDSYNVFNMTYGALEAETAA